MTTTSTRIDPREALADRLIEGVTHALETISVHLGLELGLYRAVADRGPVTEAGLAEHAGIAVRYAREWLEQQATAGYLVCDDATPGPENRRYRLPDGHAEVLLDPDSPFHAAPVAAMLAGTARALPELIEAYRTGRGVPFAAYGSEMRHGIAAGNRPMFLHELATDWLPTLPDIDRRLRSNPPARILDIACGMGASSIALAAAYPRVRVLGIDLDEESVSEARERTAEAGLADRVTYAVDDAAGPAAAGPYELVTIFEALHDMSDPVAALRAARARLAPDGALLVADERVADTFAPPGDLIERFNYGWSVLHCLPAGLAEPGGAANGSVLRASTVARWAEAAGFTGFAVLPIENPLWRFYRLDA